jgi:hypothetical protein
VTPLPSQPVPPSPALLWNSAPSPARPLSPEPVLVQDIYDVTAVINGAYILAEQLLLPLLVLE